VGRLSWKLQLAYACTALAIVCILVTLVRYQAARTAQTVNASVSYHAPAWATETATATPLEFTPDLPDNQATQVAVVPSLQPELTPFDIFPTETPTLEPQPELPTPEPMPTEEPTANPQPEQTNPEPSPLADEPEQATAAPNPNNPAPTSAASNTPAPTSAPSPIDSAPTEISEPTIIPSNTPTPSPTLTPSPSPTPTFFESQNQNRTPTATNGPTPTETPTLPEASFNNCEYENNPNLAPDYPVIIVKIYKDGDREFVTLRNESHERVDLTGWRLCSLRARQQHPIFGILAVGQEYNFQGSINHIWNLDPGDEAALYNPQGQLVSFFYR
jgi:hypothetical protein